MSQSPPVASGPMALGTNVDGPGDVLALIRAGAADTTSALAAAAGVSRSTITQRLEILLASGLVTHRAGSGGSRGRPAASFRFNADAGVVLTSQVGMTGAQYAVTDLDGTVLAQRFGKLDIPAGPATLLDDLNAALRELLDESGRAPETVMGVGIGMPNAVELSMFSKHDDRSDGWSRDYFQANLSDAFDAPVFVDVDVNLLALAERHANAPSAEVYVCVKLGTVIDAAIVVNGRPIHGRDNLAGELGHVKVSDGDAQCNCGNVGCLDAVASGDALVKQLRARGFDVAHVSDVVELSRQSVPEAVAAIRTAGKHIGEALAAVINLLNPDVISTWGYLTDAAELLFAGIREGIYQNALPGSSGHVRLVETTLGDRAGVVGAATMVIEEILAPRSVDELVGRATAASAAQVVAAAP